MHRPSTPAERREMFGPDIVDRCRIEDHRVGDGPGLAAYSGGAPPARPFVSTGGSSKPASGW